MKRPSFFSVFIATGFGSGFSPFAPGTAGALLATLVWFAFSFFVPAEWLVWITVALIAFFAIIGMRATDCVEKYWGKDPSKVVVDEMVGVWIALLAAPAGSILYGSLAFVLFRLLDIFKPLGIRKMEALPGGVGVMMDDVVAGVYSFIILIAARWLMG